MPKVVVIGAGLAGLVVAQQLQRHGFSVTVLEASVRAGGKAGADVYDNVIREHGYHIFPAWYLNVRRILKSLGVRLIDFDRFHYVRPGEIRRPITQTAPTSLRGVIELLKAGPMPPQHTLLSWYFLLDMLGTPLSNKALLDRVSRIGMMRDRWYMTETIPEMEQENVLKASAIPAYEMSAMTAKIVTGYFARNTTPFLSILPGDLQSTFIEPLVAQVKACGVTLRFNEAATALEADGERLAAVATTNDNGITRYQADFFVVATPLDVTRGLIAADVQRLDPDLGDFEHLQAVPMAALHLTLKRKLPDLPKEHVFFYQGRYGLSFIDLTPHWSGLAATTLSFIACNFVPLRDLAEDAQYEALMGEITQYIGITQGDVASHKLISNVKTPLFINTIAAWPNRPRAQSQRIDNLFFAGDWVRNPVDLACMEGAVSSALQTAREIGLRCGIKNIPEPLIAQTYSPQLLRLLAKLLAPAILPIWLYAKLTDKQLASKAPRRLP